MANLAYAAMEDALCEKEGTVEERKLRANVAEKWMERMFPTNQKTGVSLELTQNNVNLQTEINQVFGQATGKFAELVSLALNQDPKRHLRTEAPAPAPIDVEFTEEPNEDKDSEN
jgi:hypothetical protein